MAVAEKPTTKPLTPANPAQQLARASLVGDFFLLACLVVVFSVVPLLWIGTAGRVFNPFLSAALQYIVMMAAAVGEFFLGRKLEKSITQPGLRAGSVLGAVGLFIIMLITIGIAGMVDPASFGEASLYIGWGAGLIVGGILAAGLYFLFQSPRIAGALIGLESHGWFHANSFKPTQGLKVRRGTLIGLFIIIGFGVWSAVQSDLFRAFLGGSRWPGNVMQVAPFWMQWVALSSPHHHWEILLPHTGDVALFLLFDVHYIAPLLAFAVLGWFSWRLINWPSFADFLIATEAEINKVSWTTRKRLVQDTIVVLVTVVLLTFFLFVVDVIWIRVLSFPGVLQFDPQEQRQRQREASEW